LIFVAKFVVYCRHVLTYRGENLPALWRDWATAFKRELTDEGPDFLAGLRRTHGAVLEATLTLPKGQYVRREWNRAFADLVLAQAVERIRWQNEQTERARLGAP
jgi:hypothetical protein